MQNSNLVKDIVLEKAQATFSGIEIDEKTDFFSVGISSLAVVNFQMEVEQALNCTVETSELMANSTLGDWVNLYQSAAQTN
ncbi:acyl carrier protein [Pseudoalteromonas rubra]|uniref:acyl carrier protein n=1 Tax=Pseudoalteromonas rubra TaxID=43658 RepID=UPI002DBA99E9|nr:acyl carrier protein [Pseudoalteromonas rubra]MEC4090164.1 acyl carrier protein [Pseudoalteromonas rubra]